MAGKDRQAAERTAAASSISLVSLSLLALVVGIVTGLGAVLFRDLIGLIHNLFFLGTFSLHYDANLFTPASPWGPLVILVPVVGAVDRHLPGDQFRARGQGPRRPRGDGRDLLSVAASSGRSSRS